MGLVAIVNLLFRIYWFIILARVILSWIRVSPYHPTWGPIVSAIYQLTDPVIEPVRRILPPMGGLDFSPIVVLLLLDLLRSLVISVLV